MKVRIKKLHKDAVVPKKAHATDAGFDLVATSRVFDAEGNVTYGTGLAFEIPEGYVGLVFPRSSICRKDLSLSNAVGVIDSHYRGEVKAKFKPTLVVAYKDRHGQNENDYIGADETEWEGLVVTFNGRAENYPDVNDGYLPFAPCLYEVGDRICQMIILPYPEVEFEEAEELSETDRGNGGYGSTGR